MTKIGGRILGALGLAAVTASGAAADGFKSWTVCGGSTFATCASVRLNVVGTSVTLSVRNLSGMQGTYGGSVFTSIGLQNVPAGVGAIVPSSGYVKGMSGPTRGGDTPAPWRLANDKVVGGGIWLDLATKNSNGVDNGIASNCGMGSLPGAGNLFMSGSCGKSGVTNASANGGWVVLEFDVTETWDPSAAGTELMVKGVNGPNGDVTVCLTSENCSAVDVVPEPFTIALVGSGLAGLGILRRRRRKVADPA
jgi:hypothetical protein